MYNKINQNQTLNYNVYNYKSKIKINKLFYNKYVILKSKQIKHLLIQL